jgi:hypothetical protein
MKPNALRALCGHIQPNSKTCIRYAYDESGLCYHHSPHTAQRRSRNASLAGRRGGKGRLSTKVARREIRDLRSVLKYLAAHTATGTLDLAIIKGPVHWHVDRTIDLVKNYVRLCELEMKLGMTEEESHRTDVLDAAMLRGAIEAQLSAVDTSADERTDDALDVVDKGDDHNEHHELLDSLPDGPIVSGKLWVE